MELQKDKFPKTVLGYYVRLYSKKLRSKRSGNKRNLISEATKSWLNLNSKKKQAIIIKYNSRQLKLKKVFADKLRNAVPFSKSSKSETNEKSVTIHDSTGNNANTSHLNDDLSNNSLNKENNSSHCDTSQCWADNFDEPGLENANTSKNNCLSMPSMDVPEPTQIHLPRQQDMEHPALLLEPTPPQFWSNKDFYYLINKNSEHIVKWEEITRGEKAQYERAAMQIRRSYLMSYRSFLESLTPNELFNYYKNIAEV